MPDQSFDESADSPSIPASTQSGPVRRLWSRRALAAFAAAGFVAGSGSVALAWGLSGSGTNGAFTLVGQARIGGAASWAEGSCSGSSDHSDIDKGALVTVYDSSDRVVATGSLGDGEYYDSACVFPIVLPRVPDGSGSYSVRVGWRDKTRITNRQARTGSLVINLG